jgi:hypothetical protein
MPLITLENYNNNNKIYWVRVQLILCLKALKQLYHLKKIKNIKISLSSRY